MKRTTSKLIVCNSFISVNGKPVIRAIFDLSQCPIEFISDMIHIIEKSRMNLSRGKS